MPESGERDLSFEQAYAANRERVFSLACRLLRDRSAAEDLTQEVFLRAFRGYGRFRRDAAVFSWLYRITLNVYVEKRRRAARKKRAAAEVSLDDDSAGVQVADHREPGALARLEREEVRERVREAIEELPDKLKRVVILRDIEDLSYPEIAKILEVSPDAVAVRLFRARRLLREKLAVNES